MLKDVKVAEARVVLNRAPTVEFEALNTDLNSLLTLIDLFLLEGAHGVNRCKAETQTV